MDRKYTYEIESCDDGIAIREYLKYRQKMSVSILKRLKHLDDGITVNGERSFVDRILRTGDVLSVHIETEDMYSENIVPVDGDPDIIFEDEDLLILDKPPFMPVHPSKGHPYDSLANHVAGYYDRKGESFTFRCVNRLDGNTSGVVVVAKNAYCHAVLSRTKSIDKTYYAICHGIFDNKQGTVDRPIYRPEEATIRRIVSDRGKPSVTDYEVLAENKGFSFVRLKLRTGRTHQIRVHMSYIGHPLAGDFLYGDENDGFDRHMLHLGELSLQHPVTGERMTFRSKLDFRTVFDVRIPEL